MNPFDNFKNLKNAQLFPADRKRAVRKNLLAHTQTETEIGIWQLLTDKILARPLSVVLAALVLVIMGGAGIAAAAKNALPGEALYTIKTHFTEPMRAALTLRANDRAIYETELAAKRMEEAQALAGDGELDEQIQTDLAADFDDHVQEIQDHVEQTQTEHFNQVQALLIQAKAKMKTHDYAQAAEFGRQATAAAYNRGNSSSENTPLIIPSVKGESTDLLQNNQENNNTSKNR